METRRKRKSTAILNVQSKLNNEAQHEEEDVLLHPSGCATRRSLRRARQEEEGVT
jgi:hypothetical protein